MISAGHVNGFPIRREHRLVRPVLAISVEGTQEGFLIELVVAIRVAQAIQPCHRTIRRHIAHEIERLVGIQHSMRMGGLGLESFDFHILARHKRDPVKASVLIAGDETAFVIDGQTDPGSLFGFGNGVKLFHLKSGRGRKCIYGGRTTFKDLAPGFDAIHAEGNSVFPTRGISIRLVPVGILIRPFPGSIRGCKFRPIWQNDFQNQSGDPCGTIVLTARTKVVFTNDQFLLHLGIQSRAPIIGLTNRFPVENDLRKIVTRRPERGLGRQGRQIKRSPEIGCLVGSGLRGGPDPFGGFGGGGLQGGNGE